MTFYLFLCETGPQQETINNPSHPNGYFCDFAYRNKRRKKVFHQEGF